MSASDLAIVAALIFAWGTLRSLAGPASSVTGGAAPCLAPLVSLQSRENREHVRHVHQEFVITGRRD
jgi:hypothetical protein